MKLTDAQRKVVDALAQAHPASLAFVTDARGRVAVSLVTAKGAEKTAIQHKTVAALVDAGLLVEASVSGSVVTASTNYVLTAAAYAALSRDVPPPAGDAPRSTGKHLQRAAHRLERRRRQQAKRARGKSGDRARVPSGRSGPVR